MKTPIAVFLCFLCLQFSNVSAQQKSGVEGLDILSYSQLKNKTGTLVKFDYIDNARNFGEDYTVYEDYWLWPRPIYIKKNDTLFKYKNVLAQGVVFDPVSSFWDVNLNSQVWSRHTSYYFDSLSLPYKYHNFGSSVDTLAITVYNSEGLILKEDSVGNSYISIDSALSTANSRKTFSLLLDSTFNTTNFYNDAFASYVTKSIKVKVDVESVNTDTWRLPLANQMAVTFQFKPHYSFLTSDTLIVDPTNISSTNPSLFSLLNMRGNSVTYTDPGHNYGLYQFYDSLYSDSSASLALHNDNLNSPRSFPYVIYTLCNTSSVQNPQGHSFSSLYPNPAKSGQQMFLRNAPIAPLTNCKIYSETGCLIYAGDLLNNRIDLPYLNPGVYFAMLTSERERQIHKIVIH